MRSTSLVVCVLATAMAVMVSAQTPTPPVIPAQWQAGHVSVFWNVNQSAPLEVGGQLYWDYTANAIREDFSMSGATFITISQYNTQTQYQIQIGTWAGNVPACTKNPTAGAMANRNMFASATYAGQAMNGQTLCDVWWVVAPNPAGGVALNTTLYWDATKNQPVAWLSVAVDGSSVNEVSLFNFQPNTNVPGSGLFAIPTPLCSAAAAAAADVDVADDAVSKAPRIPKVHF